MSVHPATISSPSSAPAPTPISAQTPAPPKVSVEEYLERERHSEVRHEYVDGEIIAMAGESPQHNRIARNICLQLEIAFEERTCESFIENIRVRVSPTQYRYPDVVALCGEAQFDNDNPPALLNPAVVVEVLSPSTEGFDRDEKFMEYRGMACITDYVLVAQDSRLVIHYARQSPTQWSLNEYSQPEEILPLPALGVSLPLSHIYRKISFEQTEP